MENKWLKQVSQKAVCLILVLLMAVTGMLACSGETTQEKKAEMIAFLNQNKYAEAVAFYDELHIEKKYNEKMNADEKQMKAFYFYADYVDYNLAEDADILFEEESFFILQQKRELLSEWENDLGEKAAYNLELLDQLQLTHFEQTEKLNDYYEEVFQGMDVMEEFYRNIIVKISAIEIDSEMENRDKYMDELIELADIMNKNWSGHVELKDKYLAELNDYDIDFINYYYQLPGGVEIELYYRYADYFLKDIQSWIAGEIKDFRESLSYGTLEDRIEKVKEYQKRFETDSEEFRKIRKETAQGLAQRYQKKLQNEIVVGFEKVA